MINDTIELSRIDNNYIKKENISLFNMGLLIEENVKNYQDIAIKSNVKINFNYSEIYFFGNERLINHMISNLISNAIKYSKKMAAL